MTTPTGLARSVAVVSLGCARNDVDSEELAGRLAAGGWTLVDDPAAADVAVVNTCGFVEQAKKDSIDTILETADLKGTARTQKVVAVGCLAERYGQELADELSEADAVLGFDSYADMSEHLSAILAGEKRESHVPRDRRTLLPLAPARRQDAAGSISVPGHGAAPDPAAARVSAVNSLTPVAPVPEADVAGAPANGPTILRSRLGDRPWAPLKIASGCDRRCAFCAIPSFRGSFVSRRPTDVLAEARWLAERGVSEVFLVSENTTSYGKDLGDLRLLETLLPELAAVDGIERVRVSYLQPAEMRPGLIDVMTSTPGVVPYFDLSFQHASGPLLRRMRRFGDRESFLGLIESIRERAPHAGIRSNVIVGFPGESEADVAELTNFLSEARLDVVGVFGYSDEDGTEAERLDGHLPEHVVAERVDVVGRLVEETSSQRAEEREGEIVEVLIEVTDDGAPYGRAAHQGPEVDGTCVVLGVDDLEVGDFVECEVLGNEGVDLVVEPR